MTDTNHFLKIGAILMALAVVFGAFGAHIVEDTINANRFDVYRTAVQYHFYHALGLLIVGVVSQWMPGNTWIKWSGYLLIIGVLIFSGSLYLLTLLDISWLGAVTPIGGTAFIFGWICLLMALLNRPRSN